ncbi:GNAT family N-acetyltransferase [Mangrovactinospora gilvigrisea]|uniref:GNAT family N-acetyltransferase n=1 Tax=Mangrovactinospora gilvigrisea TaxID=1428644 RepID=A0A1J7C1E1_9ACTN|nr:GNAT family N-acetyltransferase [Mangrovactinospora gilvigrisea]OIV35384.1 GNAT family N-acetyltransferase [Mangrovactinospora gilvigrisea]
MDDVVIRGIDLASRAGELLDIQALAFGLTDDDIAVRRQIVARHAGYPGVRAFGAVLATGPRAGAAVGFGYGMPNNRSHWWSTVIQPYLERADHGEWLDDSFAITELHVLPAFQKRGLGRALLTTLVAGVPCKRSILSAIEGRTPARRLYHSLGYTDLAGPVRFPGTEKPYVVMGAPLPLPGVSGGAAAPSGLPRPRP